jgi:hypothetical protein
MPGFGAHPSRCDEQADRLTPCEPRDTVRVAKGNIDRARSARMLQSGPLAAAMGRATGWWIP